MEWLCSCNSQVFDCPGGNRVRLSFCVLTFSGELFFFGGGRLIIKNDLLH